MAQKIDEKQLEGDGEKIPEPRKEGGSNEYYKGYRVGYNRAWKKFKGKEKTSTLPPSESDKNRLEISVTKEKIPEPKKEQEKNQPVQSKSGSNGWIITGVIIAIVLAGVIWYVVVGRRNREASNQ